MSGEPFRQPVVRIRIRLVLEQDPGDEEAEADHRRGEEEDHGVRDDPRDEERGKAPETRSEPL
jgi:hypothetical protein